MKEKEKTTFIGVEKDTWKKVGVGVLAVGVLGMVLL